MADQNPHTVPFSKKKKSTFSIGLRFALKGIWLFFKDGRNAKIHLAAALIAVFAGIYLEIESREWLWLILAIALVFITEMLNTALEILCDLVIPYYHDRIGKLKDISAAAVLVAAMFALAVAAFIFLPRLMALWGN